MSEPLRFESLELTRMPGIEPPGFALTDLCPGINVVHGPNGCGKSTIARALQLLLWPDSGRRDRAHVAARIRLDGASWLLELDAGSRRCQRDGLDAALPHLPPPADRGRYLLALEMLLQDTSSGFAETILRESAGGYDLRAAAERLGVKEGPSRLESKPLREAQAALAGAQRAKHELVEEERELGRLREDERGAEEAGRRARALELLLERLDASEACLAAEEVLRSFPEVLEKIAGSEWNDLREMAADLEDQAREQDDASEEERKAAADMEAARLPADGVPGGLISAARADLEKVRHLESDLQTSERDLLAAEGKLEEIRRVLNGSSEAAGPDASRLDRLDHAAVEELGRLARDAEEVRAKRQALLEVERLLAGAASPDLARLEDGVRLLERWLRAGERTGPSPARLAAGLAAAALFGVLLALAWFHVRAWLSPALLFAAVAGAAMFAGRSRDARPVHAREFLKLGLGDPASWTPDDVERLAVELARRLAEARVDEARARRCAETEPTRAALDERAAELEGNRLAAAARLGLDPGTSEAGFYWLAHRLASFHEAAAEASELRSKRDAERAQADEILALWSLRLAGFGHDAIAGGSDLKGAIDDLDERRHALASALTARDSAREKAGKARDRAAKLEEKRRALHERLGIRPGEEALVQEWCGRREAYLDAKDRRNGARLKLEDADRRLAPHSHAIERLQELTREEAAARREADLQAAAEWEKHHNRIIEIETKLRAARRSREVEDALFRVDACLDHLEKERDEDSAGVVGSALVEHLQQLSRDRERPEVFHRARERLLEITRGRHRLDISDAEPPAFRAYDTITGRGQALDELSSGTRVQLLLAVRMAFVERQEQGLQLPLILDEVLANSDAVRCRAIMDTVSALAASGRQVFVFTAQEEELEKWREALRDRPGAAIKDIDLARARGIETPRLASPAPLPALSRRRPPEPDGLGRDEYREAIHAPPFDPWKEVGDVHLSHLIEDARELHALLELGIERWGQLEALFQQGAALPLPANGVRGRIEASAKVLAALLRDFRAAQGKPIDRLALVESDAVSEKFLEPVGELTRRCRGDATKVLAALEKRQVRGFRRESLDKLRDHLHLAGHLPARGPLTADEIRNSAILAADRELADGVLEPGALERLIRLVWAPATS